MKRRNSAQELLKEIVFNRPLITPQDAANRLNVCVAHIRLLLRTGQLDGVMFNNRWFVCEDALPDKLKGCPKFTGQEPSCWKKTAAILPAQLNGRQVIDPLEAAARLSVSRQRIHQMIQTGILEAVKFDGKRWAIYADQPRMKFHSRGM